MTTTTVMGSAPPVRPGVPAAAPTLGPGWSPPAWMATEEDVGPVPPPFERRTAEQTLVEALPPEQVSAAIAQANRQSAPSFQTRPPRPATSPYDIGGATGPEIHAEPVVATPRHEPMARPEPAGPGPAMAAEVEPVQRASLDEVSHRMQRIKASAVAVRQAVQQEEARRHDGIATEDREPAPRRTVRPMSVETAAPQPATAPAPAPEDDHLPPGLEDEDDDEVAEDDDFGFDDEDDDEGDHGLEDDFADLGEQPRPALRSWIPFVAAAAIAAGVGGYVLAPYLSAALFGGQTASQQAQDPAEVAPSEPAASKAVDDDPSGQVRPGSVAPAGSVGDGVAVEPSGSGASVPAADAAPETASKSVTSELAQYPSTPSTADPATQEVLAKARKLLDRGGDSHLEEARTLLEATLAAQPQLAEAMVVLSVVQLEQKNRDGSRSTATRCTKVAPQEGSCWLVLGALSEDSYLDREQPDEDRTLHKLSAIASYQQYIELDPEGRYADDAAKAIQRLK